MPVRTVPSPVGPLRLESAAGALRAVEFSDLPVDGGEPCEILDEAARQLADWFAGRRRDFDLPLAPAGTPFQQQVWAELRHIPFGETRSYADIARAIGRPAAVRAVGAANGRNPLAIVVPCHRVVGADGSLVGYGGGLERKRALLALEAPPSLFDGRRTALRA